MQITPNEIASIEEAGTLNNAPVKLIRTKGGFWIAVGRPKGKFREEALAAGSHPAIVKFNLEKEHPDFQPSMMKSENFSDGLLVEKHSHFLSDDLRKSGYDIYSVQDGSLVNFHITKYGLNLNTTSAELSKEYLTVKELDLTAPFVKALAAATVEKAIGCEVGLKIKKTGNPKI
jgi:hypothetical protein